MKLLRRLLCTAALTLNGHDGAAADEQYLQFLQAKARTLAVAQQPQWRALLHYRTGTLWTPNGSLQDDPEFFLARSGKSDPQAELDATLTAFFQNGEVEPNAHAQCRYIARYRWLRTVLQFDSLRLPEYHCNDYQRWIAELSPAGVTLVYASAFLNNPASLFGHTLLRIDSPHSRETTGLLDHAINYAAKTDRERGVWFALKGLTGGYRGRFTTLHFDVMAKQYGDIENRDLWEYRLNLSTEEIERLLMHVWELQWAYFDYFFLDENCAFHLLALLQAARPTLRLTEGFGPWVIPTDTLRRLTEIPGLTKEVAFRPARSTVIRYRQSAMSQPGIRSALGLLHTDSIADGYSGLQAFSPQEQAQVLELAEDTLQYLQASPRSNSEENRKRAFELLRYRSQLSVPNQTPSIPRPGVLPEQGHKTARLQLGFGVRDETFIARLNFRPAYHDLLDPQAGYAPGTQLQFLNLDLLAEPDTGRLRLEHLDLVDMAALTPWDPVLQSLSWRAKVSVRNRHLSAAQTRLVGGARGGLGISTMLQPSLLAYAMFEGQLEVDGKAPQWLDLSAGLATGVYYDVSNDWRLGCEAAVYRHIVGLDTTEAGVNVLQNMTISDDLSVRTEVQWRRSPGADVFQTSVALSYYF